MFNALFAALKMSPLGVEIHRERIKVRVKNQLKIMEMKNPWSASGTLLATHHQMRSEEYEV